MKNGFITLCNYIKKTVSEAEIEDFIKRAFWIKVVRESDAYTSLRISKKKSHQFFQVEGIENLKSVMDRSSPVILLTGHIGSFFIPAIAFAHLGIPVFPIARNVDHSQATPLVRRIYEAVNYKLTEKRFLGKYIFTDFSGRIDRTILNISKSGGIFWTAIDIPKTLYPHKRVPVTFLGRPSSLPSGLIQWALKRGALFLTAWSTVESQDNSHFLRKIQIDTPIQCGLDAYGILQTYAYRLSSFIYEQPWQWMGLQIIKQYDEANCKNG
jgi:lauroyl/myristoyl acyltransferase